MDQEAHGRPTALKLPFGIAELDEVLRDNEELRARLAKTRAIEDAIRAEREALRASAFPPL